MEIKYRSLIRSGNRHVHPSSCTWISASRCIGLHSAYSQHVYLGMEAEEPLLCTRCLAICTLGHRFSMEQVRFPHRRSQLPHYDTLLFRTMDAIHPKFQTLQKCMKKYPCSYRQILLSILDVNISFFADIGRNGNKTTILKKLLYILFIYPRDIVLF